MDISRTFKTPPPQSSGAVAATSSLHSSVDKPGPSTLGTGKRPAGSASPEAHAAAGRARDRLAKHKLTASPSPARAGAKRHHPEEDDKNVGEQMNLAAENSGPSSGASSISMALGEHPVWSKEVGSESRSALSSLRLTPSHVTHQDRIENPSHITYEATYLDNDGETIDTRVDFYKQDPHSPVAAVYDDDAEQTGEIMARPITPRLQARFEEIFSNRKRIDPDALLQAAQMERTYSHLFEHPGVIEIPASEQREFSVAVVLDVSHMACRVFPKGSNGALGTMGLATCIGIGARGETRAGEIVLGLDHYSEDDLENGGRLEPDDALQRLFETMVKNGAKEDSIGFYLAGGQLAPSETESNTLDLEEEFLSCKNFNIVAVRLHATRVECNELGDKIQRDTGDEHDDAINAVMTEEGLYFSHGKLFANPWHSGESESGATPM